MFASFKFDRDYISSGYCSTRPRPSRCPICKPATPLMTYEDYMRGHGYEPQPDTAQSTQRFQFPNYSTLFGRGIDDYICLFVTYCHEWYLWYIGTDSQTAANRSETTVANSQTSNIGNSKEKRKCSCFDTVVSIPGTPSPASRRTVYPTGNWKTTRKRRFVATIKPDDELSEENFGTRDPDNQEPRMAGLTLRDIVVGPPLDEVLLSLFFLIYDFISPPGPGESLCENPWCSITEIRDAAAVEEGGRYNAIATSSREGESSGLGDVSEEVEDVRPMTRQEGSVKLVSTMRQEGPVDVARWLHEEYLSLAQDIKDSQDQPFNCEGPLCPETLKQRQATLDALEELHENKQGLEEDKERVRRSRIASTYHVTQVMVMTAIPEITRQNKEAIQRCREYHMLPQPPVPVPRDTLASRHVSYACDQDDNGELAYDCVTCPETDRDDSKALVVRCKDAPGVSSLTSNPSSTSHGRRRNYDTSSGTCESGETDGLTTSDESSSSISLSQVGCSILWQRSRSLSPESNASSKRMKRVIEKDSLVTCRSRSLTPRSSWTSQCACSMKHAINLATGLGEFVCACGAKVLNEGKELLAPVTGLKFAHGSTRRQYLLQGRGAFPSSRTRVSRISRTRDEGIADVNCEGKNIRDRVMSRHQYERKVNRHWDGKYPRGPVMSRTQDEGIVDRICKGKSPRDRVMSRHQYEEKVNRHWDGKYPRGPVMTRPPLKEIADRNFEGTSTKGPVVSQPQDEGIVDRNNKGKSTKAIPQDEGIAISDREWTRSVSEGRMLRHLKEETHIKDAGVSGSENGTTGTSSLNSLAEQTGSSESKSSLTTLWSKSRSESDTIVHSSLKDLKSNSSTTKNLEKSRSNDTLELEVIHFPQGKDGDSSSDVDYSNPTHAIKSQESLVDLRPPVKNSPVEQTNTKIVSDELIEDPKVNGQDQRSPLSTSHYEPPIFKENTHAPSDINESRYLNTTSQSSPPTNNEDISKNNKPPSDKRTGEYLNKTSNTSLPTIKKETLKKLNEPSDKMNGTSSDLNLLYASPTIKKETSVEQIVNSDKKNSRDSNATLPFPPPTIKTEALAEQFAYTDKKNSRDSNATYPLPPSTIKEEASAEQIAYSDKRNSRDSNTTNPFPPPSIKKETSVEQMFNSDKKKSRNLNATLPFPPPTIKDEASAEQIVNSDKKNSKDSDATLPFPPPTTKKETSVEKNVNSHKSSSKNMTSKVKRSEDHVQSKRMSSTDVKGTLHNSPPTPKDDNLSKRNAKSDKRKQKSNLNSEKVTQKVNKSSVRNGKDSSTSKSVNESIQPEIDPRIEHMNKLIQGAKMDRNTFRPTSMVTVKNVNLSFGGNAFKAALSDNSMSQSWASDKEPQENAKIVQSSHNTSMDIDPFSQSNLPNDYVIIDNQIDLENDRHALERKAVDDDDDDDYLIIERPTQYFRVNSEQVRSREYPSTDSLIEITENQYERHVRRHNNGVTITVPNETHTEVLQFPLTPDSKSHNAVVVETVLNKPPTEVCQIPLTQDDLEEITQKVLKDLNLNRSKSVKWDPTKHVRNDISQGKFTDVAIPETECIFLARKKSPRFSRCATWKQKHEIKDESQAMHNDPEVPQLKCVFVARKKSPSLSRCATWNQKQDECEPPEPVPTCQQAEDPAPVTQLAIEPECQNSMTRREEEQVVCQRREDRKCKSSICSTPRVSRQRLGITDPCGVNSSTHPRDKIKLGQIFRDIKIASHADRRVSKSASKGHCVCSVIVHAGSIISSEEPKSNRTPSGVFVRPERCTCATGKSKDLAGSSKEPIHSRGNQSRVEVRSLSVVAGPNEHKTHQSWVQNEQAEDAASFLRPLRVIGSNESVILVGTTFQHRLPLQTLPKEHKSEKARKQKVTAKVGGIKLPIAVLPRLKKHSSRPDGEQQFTAEGNKNSTRTAKKTHHKVKSILKLPLKDGPKTNGTGLMEFIKDVGNQLLSLNILGGFVNQTNYEKPSGSSSRPPVDRHKRQVKLNPIHHMKESKTRRENRRLANQGQSAHRQNTLGQPRVSVNKLKNATEKRRNARTSAVRKNNTGVIKVTNPELYYAPDVSSDRTAFKNVAILLGQKTRSRSTRVNRAPDHENEAAAHAHRARRPSLARGDDHVPRHDSPRRHRHVSSASRHRRRHDAEVRRTSDPRRHRDHGHASTEPRVPPKVRSPGGHQRNFIVNHAEIVLDDPSVKYTGKYLLREQMRIMRELQAKEDLRRAKQLSISLGEKGECKGDSSSIRPIESKPERLKVSVIPNYNIQLEVEDTHGVFDVPRSKKSFHFEMSQFANIADLSTGKRHGTSLVKTEESASKTLNGSHDYEPKSSKNTQYFGGREEATDSNDKERVEHWSKVQPLETKHITSNLKLMRSSTTNVVVSDEQEVDEGTKRDAFSSLVCDMKLATKQPRPDGRSVAVYDENDVLCRRTSSKRNTEFSKVRFDNKCIESYNVNTQNKCGSFRSVLTTERSSIAVIGKTSQDGLFENELIMKSDPRKRVPETESEDDVVSVSSPKSVSRSSSHHDWTSQLPIRTVDEFLQDQLRGLTNARDKKLIRETRSEESVTVPRLRSASRSSSEHDWSSKLPQRSVDELLEVQMQRLTTDSRGAKSGEDRSFNVARSQSSFSVLTDDLWSEMGTVYDNHVIT